MTPNGVFLLSLDREVLAWMKKAGCYKLCFGIESGDPETQRFIHKRVPLDRCKQIVKEANRLGIWTHGFFILGLPFETGDAIHRTLAYAVESDLDFASFFLAVPYPQTELYQIMKDHGMLEGRPGLEDFRGHGGHPTLHPPGTLRLAKNDVQALRGAQGGEPAQSRQAQLPPAAAEERRKIGG